MLSELGRRQGIVNNEGPLGDEFEKEIGLLLCEQRRHQSDDHEKELNLFRSGSAPPTVEGSLSAVGELLIHGGGGGGGSGGLSKFTEYAVNKSENVNLNPRLPPPLLRKVNWNYNGAAAR